MSKIATLALLYGALCMLLGACGQKTAEDSIGPIRTSKTEKHTRVIGTKVFGVIPSGYEYYKEIGRYQKHKDLYIQITEIVGSFAQWKLAFDRDSIEAKGAKVDIMTQVTLNEYEALYFEGPSKFAGETKLGLVFGDSTFAVLVVAVCKTNDIEGKKQLQEIMKTLYYDKNLAVDEMEMANFNIDLSITNFSFGMTSGRMYQFSENGKMDMNDSAKVNLFQVKLMPAATEEQAEKYSNDLCWRYELSGAKFSNKKVKKTEINNHTAFVLESMMTMANEEALYYQALIMYESACVFFVGWAVNDYDANLGKYKKTVETIRIK